MFLYCRECAYDSDDFYDEKSLAEKVISDGGLVFYTDKGWLLECPYGHQMEQPAEMSN